MAAVYGRHYLDRALAQIKRFVRVHGPLYRAVRFDSRQSVNRILTLFDDFSIKKKIEKLKH